MVQEVAAFRVTIVLCGDSVVPWVAIQVTLMAIEQHSKSLERLRLPNGDDLIAALNRLTSVDLFKPVVDMNTLIIRANDDRQEPISLLTNLEFMRITSSTDERDKVYAAFGISNQAEITGIDYALPVRDVYTKVAQKSISENKGYAVLSFCKYPPQGISRLGLPTWVPDWADRQPQDPSYVHFYHTGLTT